MLSATRIRNACPQCRAQLLRLCDRGIAGSARLSCSTRSPDSRLPRQSRAPRRRVRAFSTTRPGLQETQIDNTQSNPEDIETIVRQAKATFGDTLPPDYLSAEEYKLYERLYGPPLRPTLPEDVGIPFASENEDAVDSDVGKHTLLREVEGGALEEVEYTIEEVVATDADLEVSEDGDAAELELSSSEHLDYINVRARNKREYDALVKLRGDFEAASLRHMQEEEARAEEQEEQEEPEEEEEEEDEIEEDEEYEEDPDAQFGDVGRLTERSHPLSLEGQFRTSPTTLYLPKEDFVVPITELLKRTDIKHLREASEKTFGGRGLPHSSATPKAKHNHAQKGIALEVGHRIMSEIEADAYIAAVMPGVYSTAMSALVEVRKRLGSGWIQGLSRSDGAGPRVLDVGGAGAGLAAWDDVFQAEWKALGERAQQAPPSEVPPLGKKSERTVVIGSDTLRYRVSRFLHNTTFLPRLPDHVHSSDNLERHIDAPAEPQPRKRYDVIIASHMLMHTKPQKRKEFIANLWAQLNPDGGVLIVLEKGHPRGFEAVADVRQRMLDDFITGPAGPNPEAASESIESEEKRVREPGMIIAPCTNHTKCPMYLTPGLAAGRKDFCHFSQRFIRPPFLQRILNQAHRNHEDIDFSYLAIRRGVSSTSSPIPAGPQNRPIVQGKAATDLAFAGYEGSDRKPNPLSLPRNILPPLKRHGHVILDLCTPAGQLERWTVPKSLGKQVYHDARKARWGDLWALGAKTRVARPVRLGRGGPDGAGAAADGGVRSELAAKGGKKGRPRVIELHADESGITGASEKFPGGRAPVERRTKGGKKAKIRELMRELDDDLVDFDEDEEEMATELERKKMEKPRRQRRPKPQPGAQE